EATDMDRAISLFQKAIQKDPKFAPAYADLGFADDWKYAFTHEKYWLDQASEACVKALALNHQLASAHVSFGMVQRHTGHLEQAIAEYQRALQLDPENEDAREMLSLAYDSAGRLLEAETLQPAGLRSPGRHLLQAGPIKRCGNYVEEIRHHQTHRYGLRQFGFRVTPTGTLLGIPPPCWRRRSRLPQRIIRFGSTSAILMCCGRSSRNPFML